LAFGANLPVIGISTLMALAQANGSEKVMACMDARMGEIYHAAYIKHGGGWDEVSAPGLSKPEAMPTIIGDGWTGVGNGWKNVAQHLEDCYGSQMHQISPDVFPHAAAMAELAIPLFEAGQGRPAAEAAPVYIRN